MIREHDIYFKKVYGSNLSIGILVEIQAQSKQSKNSDFWTKIDHKVQFQGWALGTVRYRYVGFARYGTYVYMLGKR